MKNKKIFIIVTIVLLILIFAIAGLYFYLRDPNKLTSAERRFLANNATTIQNISIVNNVDVFGEAGAGLYYDFIDDFSDEYGIDVNTVAYNLGENVSGISFGASNTLSETDVAFYTDHYVLVSKKYEYIDSNKALINKKIGVLSSNLSYITSYLENGNQITLTSYNSDEELLKAFNEQTDIQYMVVPMHLYLDKILSNGYKISYHFSDMSYYYKFSIGEDNLLGSILKKYYNVWNEDNLVDYYQDHLFNVFIDSLNISLTEVDAMRSVSYDYGFVNNSPYEILSGGNYGGIIAQYLKEFTEFSDTELNFTKYKKYSQFKKAVDSQKVDFYFEYYSSANTYKTVPSAIGIDYKVIVNKEDSMVVNSLKSLETKEVYVEENTVLYNYLKNNTQLNIKTYNTKNELEKLAKKNKIIILDSNVYDAYQQSIFANYNSRYSMNLNDDYEFKLNTNETFAKLFEAFVNYKDSAETIYKGIYNHDKTLQSGTLTGTIAKYFIYLLVVFLLVFLYVYKIAKRVKISKKIKKEDKLKYIDQLTSLKNRNYLSENLENWGKNTIYPQTVIVIDLNNLQYINDTMGYEQGDIQIKAVANILVKTQLDNSDIIRTDGNEFVIYLVGYQTKQITSYIHKLNKEFKKLPYEYGAAIGYSMIEDDIKSVEDAINEAVEDVKNQKNNKKEAAND